jgi:hypothetical protein
VSTISRLGVARPVSTKLTCRGITRASVASASWLIRRTCRQNCNNCPTCPSTPPTPPPRGRASALGERIGFIPNLAATMAASPVLLTGFGGLQETLRTSTLTGAEREFVGLTVSHENACRYSMAAHSVFAGAPVPDAKLAALHEFTVRHPGRPRVRGAGLG